MVVIAAPVSHKKDTERSHILPDIKGQLLRVSKGTVIVQYMQQEIQKQAYQYNSQWG